MNQKSPKVATPRKQHVTMSLEHTALHEDAAVTEEVPFTLLVKLKEEFGQVARHVHVAPQEDLSGGREKKKHHFVKETTKEPDS